MRLVFLYGGAAVGKLTVAKALAQRTGLALFHNHLVVDALLAVFPFGDPAFVKLREEMWLSVFREAAGSGRSLIFTFAPEPTVAPDLPDRIAALWRGQGGRVDFVRLVVSRQEQEARLSDPSRAAFGKLASVDLLRQLRSEFEACEARMPAPALTLDTGKQSAETSAHLIAEALGLPNAAA